MRSLPQHRARGQCYIPLDLLARRGLTLAHVLAGRADAAMAVLLAELRHLAESRLGEARAAQAEVPVAALPAFLPASLADTYLRKLARIGAAVLRGRRCRRSCANCGCSGLHGPNVSSHPQNALSARPV